MAKRKSAKAPRARKTPRARKVPAKRRGGYPCGVCGLDLSADVAAILRAKDTVTAQMRVARFSIETDRGMQGFEVKSGRQTVWVTCRKGHDNIFEV